MYLYIFISLGGDFPGGPVVRTLPSNARVAGLIPGFGELRGFPVAQMVKNPPAMWETCVQSLS